MQLAKFFRGTIVPGTVRAERALVPDSNKDLASLRNLTVSGTLTVATIAGAQAHSTMPKFPVATVAAAGADQAGAAALVAGISVVTGPDDNKGVRLPVTTGGDIVIIKLGDGADLKIYPATGAAINAETANAAITVADDLPVFLFSVSATQWYTLPLVPS